MSANAPVGTTLALLESASLRSWAAVQVPYALFDDVKSSELLKTIIADYTPDEYHYEPLNDGSHEPRSPDYD
jgi:hypothetical protein